MHLLKMIPLLRSRFKQLHPFPEKKLVIPQHLQHNKKPALDAEGAKEKWKTIENAIHQIYQQNASSLSFQNLYTSGYQIILHKHGDILYNGVEETITQHIVGEREKVMACAEPVFLQELLDHWEKHRTAVSMIRDILMYMVCHWSSSVVCLFNIYLGMQMCEPLGFMKRRRFWRVRVAEARCKMGQPVMRTRPSLWWYVGRLGLVRCLSDTCSNHNQDKNYVPQHKKLGVYDLGVKIFGECMLKDKKVCCPQCMHPLACANT